MTPLIHSFVGGTTGKWRVERVSTLTDPALSPVPRLAIFDGDQSTTPEDGVWLLRGVTSYERYVHRTERSALVACQPDLGRPNATRAALIPIKKSVAWWELTQDERRMIFEERSHHITVGLRYLPAIARRLYHSHDLGEPFDFLTWFEYAPTDAAAFEELVGTLRDTEEWSYVEREIDIRLVVEDSF
jgi:chlorite dismutase